MVRRRPRSGPRAGAHGSGLQRVGLRNGPGVHPSGGLYSVKRWALTRTLDPGSGRFTPGEKRVRLSDDLGGQVKKRPQQSDPEAVLRPGSPGGHGGLRRGAEWIWKGCYLHERGFLQSERGARGVRPSAELLPPDREAEPLGRRGSGSLDRPPHRGGEAVPPVPVAGRKTLPPAVFRWDRRGPWTLRGLVPERWRRGPAPANRTRGRGGRGAPAGPP